ncbi:MAG: hypothetical protein AB1478_03675 [Nitrospirota bacterium]
MNKLLSRTHRTIVLLTVFSMAMGFLEAAVVFYLRQLYYPEGFVFPLKLMTTEVLVVEYLREISTIIMLSAISIITGKNFPERFSLFLYTFGIWDIFYYVWLKVLLNWPSSFLTLDILFLIPVVWVGPVLAPVICSITMILIAGCIIYFQQKGYPVNINMREWMLLLLGVLIIFSTFVWEYSKIVIKEGFISSFLALRTNQDFQRIVSQYIPIYYNWYLFILGEVLVLCALWLFCRRMKSTFQNSVMHLP